MQIAEVTEFWGYLTGQMVVREGEFFQVGEVFELGGYLADQLVIREIQVSNAATVVGGYAVPLA